MALTVLSVAYPFAPVSADAVGGAEQVAASLDAALVRAGHRSLVLAAAGSSVRGELLPLPVAAGPIGEAQRAAAWQAQRQAIGALLARGAVDLVHFHGIDFPQVLPPPGPVPLLATLHLPPSWYPPALFAQARGDLTLQCVSQAQRAACPPAARPMQVIDNGVPLRQLAARVRKRPYALALGRICPEKNLHVALDAGRLAGLPVLLGGQVFPYDAHQRYWRESVCPRLDRWRRFLGPVPFGRKRRLLAGARCLLVPSLAPETSSLVAMEALACGTPVVAYPSGALPGIVEHGRTGFLVRTPQEMALAMRACAGLDPQECRAAAQRRFGQDRMAARYLALYARLAAGLPADAR